MLCVSDQNKMQQAFSMQRRRHININIQTNHKFQSDRIWHSNIVHLCAAGGKFKDGIQFEISRKVIRRLLTDRHIGNLVEN